MYLLSVFIHVFTIYTTMSSLAQTTSIPQSDYDRFTAFPNRFRHTVRASASSFKFQHPLFSTRSYNSYLPLLPRLPVTYILPCIFSSMTCFRRRLIRNILKLYNVEHFEMMVSNSFEQSDVFSVPKFAGRAVKKDTYNVSG